LKIPTGLEGIVRDDTPARVGHSYGKSYADVVRAVTRQFPHPPDLVAYPNNEKQLVSVLDWCASSNVAVVPYGGGTSVVGGVEPDIGENYKGCVTVDLSRFDKVMVVDTDSLSARIQAGATGPAIDNQLSRYGLTLRHYPQSFEFSTLGVGLQQGQLVIMPRSIRI
jgi:FAD/FMN-containing dehydrogenases